MSASVVNFVGHYEILSQVGAGGMGEVYKAQDPRLNRTVAIKILPEFFARDAARLHRFQQEARVVAALSHPNIVTIYDVGTHEGKPYLVTEFLTGKTLRQHLCEGALPVRKSVNCAVEIAEALGAAHRKGIIHRDLKPENIFLTAEGRVKVLDFGLARIAAPAIPSDELSTLASGAQTEPGVVMGTVGYMSPEQVRGQPLDHKSDIFSFGAVFYEMVSGKRAFHGASSVETMNAILKEEPPEILAEHHDLPPAIDRILRHCLEKEPQRRFESAQDLAFDLAAISTVSESSARLTVATGRMSKRRAAAARVIAVVIAVLSLILGMRLQHPVTPRFHRLTFQRGYVFSARFAPDRKTVLYSATWSGNSPEIFSTTTASQDSRGLGISNADLLAVSSKGELAVLLRPSLDMAGFLHVGTLARIGMSGSTAPREIAQNIAAADWSPDGKELAVLRVDRQKNNDILEYPLGKAIYQSTRTDWLSHVRISPDGRLIAVLQHNGLNDDRGRVLVFDTAGKQKFSSDILGGVYGLAWIEKRKLWVTATTPVSSTRQLFEVDLDGTSREVVEVPDELTLQDVAADGTALVTTNERNILMHAFSQGKWHDLSWLDRTIFDRISADGLMILFHEGGQGVGALGATYIRNLEGSPPIRLSEGYGVDLSPDKKWALVWVPLVPAQYRLVPTGAGEAMPVKTPDIPHVQAAGFRRDQRGLVWVGKTPDDQPQTFVTELDGSNPRPLGPAGTVLVMASLNGKYDLRRSGNDYQLWEFGQTASLPVTYIEPGDRVLSLSDDAQWVYVARFTEIPSLKILHVNLRTGAAQLLTEVAINDLAGIVSADDMSITPDGKVFVIGFVRHLSQLYLLQGGK